MSCVTTLGADGLVTSAVALGDKTSYDSAGEGSGDRRIVTTLVLKGMKLRSVFDTLRSWLDRKS